METISIGNLPKGTRKKLEKNAIDAGCKKVNGTANISEYVRTLIEAATVKQ